MKTEFKVGDVIWVRDTVKAIAKSEPSVLPTNGVWVRSENVVREEDVNMPYDSPGRCSMTELG